MMEEPMAVATVDVGPNLSGMGALEYAFRATQNYPELWNTGQGAQTKLAAKRVL